MTDNKAQKNSMEETLRRKAPQQGLMSAKIYQKQLEAADENAKAEDQSTPDTRTFADKQSLAIEETREAREEEKKASEVNQRRESENGLYGNTQMISSSEVEEPEVLGYTRTTLKDRLTVRSEEEQAKVDEKTQAVNDAQRKAGVQAEETEEPKKSQKKSAKKSD